MKEFQYTVKDACGIHARPAGLLGTLGGGNAVIAPIMLPIMAPAVRRRPRAAVATGLVLCISLAFSTKSLVDAAKILTWLPAPEACTI